MKTVVVVVLITIWCMSLSVDAECWCRGHRCLHNEVEVSTCEGPWDSKPYCCSRDRPLPRPPVVVRRCGCRFHECAAGEVEVNTCEGLWDSKPYCCEQ